MMSNLDWRVSIDSKIICEGFKTKEDALDFVVDELGPTLVDKEALEDLLDMRKYGIIFTTLKDNGIKMRIKLTQGMPNGNLVDFTGL